MKKFLALLSVVAVAGFITNASAVDRAGSIGFGIQESFTAGVGATTLGSWSLKYGVSSNMTGQFVVGLDFGNKGFNKVAQFGARLLYDLVENENSDFYTGVGIAWIQDKAPADARALRFHIPLGWEFSFAGLPEVGFSVEAGLVYDYVKAPKQSQIMTMGGLVGGNLGLGAHYYF